MASGTRAAVLRRLARRAGVPVVEDVPLARSLFRLAEAGEPIPDELHHAVAVVLARVAPLAHAGEWW
jgi:flagellar biosynthetic protein FlhB